VYDRELINMAAKESGLATEVFENSDEKPVNVGKIARYFGLKSGGYADSQDLFSSYITDDNSLFNIQSQVVKEIAAKGSAIFVGRCADYILRDSKELLSVFITADREDKIKRIMKRHGMDEAQAEHYMDSGDRKRKGYYDYFTFKQWGDSKSYHVCLNSSKFGIEGCADIIISLLEKM
ncbi:MAG: cytidylate kinase-like family protein, partial [Bacteroidales bacterium]|nr:cytidylate kinase-like family protein [Bacteroidales bacterium]